MTPASATAIVSRTVATGRLMNGAEMLTRPPATACAGTGIDGRRPPDPPGEPIEGEIDHRRRVQRQELTEDQPADDGDAERTAQLRSGAGAERQRHAAEQRRHRRHDDGTETQQRRLEDRVERRSVLLALGLEREVDHHDRVLLDDADEQDDADERNHAELGAAEHQRQQRADAGRRQRRQNRDRVDVALVEHAEHDVDGDDGRQNQQRLVRQRRLKRLRGSLKARLHADRQADVLLHRVDRVDRAAERRARREIERDGHHRKLALVVDDERDVGRPRLREGAERHLVRRSTTARRCP